MAIDRETLIHRARRRSEKPGDFWDNLAAMVAGKPAGAGIGIS